MIRSPKEIEHIPTIKDRQSLPFPFPTFKLPLSILALRYVKPPRLCLHTCSLLTLLSEYWIQPVTNPYFVGYNK
jgi:hypothetical protein